MSLAAPALALTLLVVAQAAPPPDLAAPGAPAKPRWPEDVRLFHKARPDRPFRVVARVQVTAADCDDVGFLKPVTDEKLLSALKREAAASGADAVIDVSFEDVVLQRVTEERGSVARSYDTQRTRVAFGTLVRFSEEVGVETQSGLVLFFGDEAPPFPFDEVRLVEATVRDVSGSPILLRHPSRAELIRALLWKARGEGDALIGVEIVDEDQVMTSSREDPAHVSLRREPGYARIEVREREARTTETVLRRRKAVGVVIERRAAPSRYGE